MLWLAAMGCSGSHDGGGDDDAVGGAGSAGTGSAVGGSTAGGTAGSGGSAGGAGMTEGGECRTPVEELPLVDTWAKEVLLGVEFGAGEGFVRRWGRPIRASMMEGTEAQRSLLGDVTGTLTSVLDGTGMSVTLGADGDRTAQMLVWFTPYANFTTVANAEGFEVFPGNYGMFYFYWDASSAFTRVYVLLASDLLLGEDLVHFTFEEVTQSLGPANDSAIMPDSIFFANGADGGHAQAPSCYDEALLNLLYAHLSPGDVEADVDAAVGAYWDQRP